MENIKIGNKRTLTDDPQYFGGYLNAARHNVFLIITHLMKKFKFEKRLEDDEDIANVDMYLNSMGGKDEENNKTRVLNFLKRYLPFTKIFDPDEFLGGERCGENIDFAKVKDTIKELFFFLNETRNKFSHYYSKNDGNERIIIINDSLAVFIRKSYQVAIEITKARYSGTFHDEDFEIANNKELVNSANELTEAGMVFFCSWFLERGEAFRFINRVIGFKDTRDTPFLATREVLLAFCAKLPMDKFISNDPENGFFLDMANDLNRCPRELFKCLTEEEKKQFKPDLDKLKQLNVLDNSMPGNMETENYENYIKAITSRVRRTDRFNCFALKFLDLTRSFETLRFHINLGKFEIASYKKDLMEVR